MFSKRPKIQYILTNFSFPLPSIRQGHVDGMAEMGEVGGTIRIRVDQTIFTDLEEEK
jgi:hypothetical protein